MGLPFPDDDTSDFMTLITFGGVEAADVCAVVVVAVSLLGVEDIDIESVLASPLAAESDPSDLGLFPPDTD